MSDDNDLQEDESGIVHLPRTQIQGMQDKARRVDAAETRALAAERELAFAKAGIDLSDSRMAYFRKGYDGDLEADAIKAAATEAGFLTPPASGEGSAPDAALAAQQQIADAGSTAPGSTDPNPLADAIAAAQTKEELDEILRNTEGVELVGHASEMPPRN